MNRGLSLYDVGCCLFCCNCCKLHYDHSCCKREQLFAPWTRGLDECTLHIGDKALGNETLVAAPLVPLTRHFRWCVLNWTPARRSQHCMHWETRHPVHAVKYLRSGVPRSLPMAQQPASSLRTLVGKSERWRVSWQAA